MNAVRNIQAVHLNAGRNFGLSQAQLVLRVIYPAVMPQLIVALRISLGIAWLVAIRGTGRRLPALVLAAGLGEGLALFVVQPAGDRRGQEVGGKRAHGWRAPGVT